MEKTFGQELIESLTEATAIAQGKTVAARTHIVDVPDVRAIRERLKMTQPQFSRAYGIPLPTLKGWEQGRRLPDATASAYLSVIAKIPKETQAALSR